MKNTFCTLFCFVAALLSVGADTIENATVTLPYAELAELLEKSIRAEEAAEVEAVSQPVSVIVHAAEYTVICGADGAASLKASFDVSNLSDTWQAVALIGAGRAVSEILPAEAKVAEIDGMLRLLLEPNASASVELSLMPNLAAAQMGTRTIASFEAMPASRSRLIVEKPSADSSTVIVSGAVSADQDKRAFGLPSAGGLVKVKLYQPEDLTPALWNANAQYLVTEVDGSMRLECRLRLNAAGNGRTTSARLRVPAMADLVSVESPDLAGAYMKEMTSDGLILNLSWVDDEATARFIDLDFLVPIEQDSEQWTVEGVEIENLSQQTHRFYIERFDGIELKPLGSEWSSLGNPPTWIQNALPGADLFLVETSDQPGVQLTVRSLPRLETVEATIKLAEFTTELVEEGSVLSQAKVHIEHDTNSAYSFTLPQESRLLTCTVNGRKTMPLIGDGDELILPLPKQRNERVQTVVSYTYTAKSTKFDPVEGKADLRLPLTPLFTHKLKWVVRIPDEYEATALEGNVLIDAGGAGKPILLSKQIYLNEAPFAALNYTRRELK